MFKKLDLSRMPKHIAFIMDGNGRWATRRALPRLAGHKEGVEAIKRVVAAGKKFNLQAMSFYAFSTENWKRDKNEVDGIFDLIEKYLVDAVDVFLNENIKFVTMGDLAKLPKNLQQILNNATEKTKKCDSLTINMAINYGGRDEIVYAVNKLIKSGKKTITDKDISNNLYTNALPDPDLMIRTSGELRLSNFMLYQLAYSEFYFPKYHWPDFNEKRLKKAIIAFQKRDRRFGNVKQGKK